MAAMQVVSLICLHTRYNFLYNYRQCLSSGERTSYNLSHAKNCFILSFPADDLQTDRCVSINFRVI